MKHEVVSETPDTGRDAALDPEAAPAAAADGALQRLTRLASRLVASPIAVVSLAGDPPRLISSCSDPALPWSELLPTPLWNTLRGQLTDAGEPLIVENLRDHPLFAGDAALADREAIALVGLPLITAEGQGLGSFWVFDRQPRHWTAEQIEVLTDLASAMVEIGGYQANAVPPAERAVPDRFEDLVEGLDAVVWEMDVDTFRFTYINQRAEHVFGYPVQRWLEEPTFWQDVLLHPEDRDWALDFCQSATRRARDHEFEYRAVRADGEVVWLRDLVRVVRDEAGAARGLRGVMIDISAQKRAAAQLREREAQLAEAQRVAHIGSWELDLETGTLSWSDEAYRLCGLEPQSVALTTEIFLGLVHPDDRGRVRDAIGRALREGEPYCIEARLQRGDDTLRHAQMRGEAVKGRHGRPVRLRGTGQDITELVRAEQALRASEESYRTIFQHSSDAIWLHDLETGEMLDVNQAGCEMFGYSFEEMMTAGHDALLYPGSEYTAERVSAYMARAAAGETPRFEWMGRHKNGSPVWGEITLRRVSIGGKDHILASVRDVTQRKAAEDARRAAEQDARTMATRMRAVAGAAAGLIGVDSLEALLPVLKDACQQVISLDAFWLSLYDEADHTFAYAGYDLGELVPTQTISATGTPSERVLRRRESIITHRSTDPDAAGGILLGTRRRSESIIRTPILSGQRVLGVISVQSYTPHLYAAQDVEVLETIASLAASALLNVELLAELRASEESYRTVFEASGDAIYVLDKDTGAILDVNRAACELNGYPPEEMKSRGIGGLSYDRPPYNWDNAQELIRRAAAGEPQRLEWLARHSSGRDVWGEVTLQRVTILGEDRVLATARDITERRAAEEARRQAEQDAQATASRMRAVAAAAAGVIGAESVDALQVVLREECRRVMPFDAFTMALYDEAAHTLAYLEGFDAEIEVPARTIAAAGTPGERVIHSRRSLLTRRSDEPAAAGARPMGTGRRSESIIRTPILSGDRVLGLLSVQSYTPDLYSQQDVEVLEAIASLAATALLNLELLAQRKQAEQALLRANQELEQRVAERTAELAATNAALEEEIAEREVARAELQQRTEELEAIFQALPDLYFRLDADGTIMEYRSGSEEGLYLAPEEFLGRRLPELLPAEVGQLVRDALDEVEQTRRLVCVEYPLTLNGSTCEYEARLLPLEDGSLISIIRNITDRKRAERELQHREEHFRSLIENGSDLIVVVDAEGITRYMSPSALRVIGWAPEERVGKHSFDLIHPLDRARVGDCRTEALNHPGTTVPVEFRYRHRSGEWVVLDGMVKTIRQDSSEDGLVLSARDITERKEFEQQLQQREEHFRRLIENAHDLVQVLDTNGTTLYISPSVQRLTGYRPEELIGRDMSILAHPSETEIGAAKLAQTAANPGAIIRGEFRIVHKDGSVRVMETFGRTLSPTSADEGIVVNARDITERCEAEEALRRSEEHFRRLIENAHDLVMVVDASARIEYVSPSVERILGFSPDELVGTPGFELVHPEDVELGQQGLGETVDVPGNVTVTEIRLRHKDGGYRRVESLARTLSSDTADAGIVINVRDITEHYHAEQALRDSEARYRSLIENAHDIVTILDLEGRITYQSPQVERVLGYEPAEMIGQSALDYVHPQDLAIPSQALEEILAAPGATYFNEYRFRHKDGSWRYLETFGRTLVPESPEQGLVFNTRDVTERREAQRALQEREEHFRRLIEKSGDMIQLLDSAGRITYTGPSVERLLGYTPEEIQGTDALSYIHPDDLQQTAAALMRMLATPEEVQTAEYRVRHKAGNYRMFEAFARTVFEASGEQVVVVNARDVTERKQAEAELKRQRAYFEQLLASVDAGIAAWDPQGRFEYVSPNAVEDPEIREWIVGKTHHEYCARRGLPRDLAELRWAAVSQAIETRTQTEYEETVRRRDGTDAHFLRRSRPIINEAGELERVIGYSVDITERKRTEEAVRRANAEAEQARETAERANRAKSEFLSRMSHELRTPMNSILGFAQLLERAALPAEQKKGVGHILKAGRHLLQLINEVLEISRIEAGRHSLSLEPVPVGVVLQEALDLVRPLANQWGVSLQEGPWAHGNVFVQADRQRLAQVLLNLLSNAIKYNRPAGRVKLDCGISRSTDSGARLWIRIADTGRGIPAERLDQLFTPFARLGAEQTAVEGTGLGLALSQRLCEAMGGLLSLESTGEAGSIFRIELVITDDPVQQLDGQTEPLQVLDGVPHAPATLLYIEDNLANLSLVETILLSRPHWRTVPALQGQLGLELAREHQPNLILLDLHLPDIPGSDVLRRLRADARTAHIPVVVISADATPSAIERLRALGADAYLTKPLEIDEFLQTLERFLPEPETHHDPD